MLSDDPGDRWSWRALAWFMAAIVGSLLTIAVGRAIVPRYELHEHFPVYIRLDRHTGELAVCQLRSQDSLSITCAGDD